MGFIFKSLGKLIGGGAFPMRPVAPTAPRAADKGPQIAGSQMRKRLGAQASTVLTGGQGVTEEANIARKTLLGA